MWCFYFGRVNRTREGVWEQSGELTRVWSWSVTPLLGDMQRLEINSLRLWLSSAINGSSGKGSNFEKEMILRKTNILIVPPTSLVIFIIPLTVRHLWRHTYTAVINALRLVQLRIIVCGKNRLLYALKRVFNKELTSSIMGRRVTWVFLLENIQE